MKKRINVTIEQHVLEMLDQMVIERGVSRSSMLSYLILEEVNDYYKKNALEAHEAAHVY